MKRSSRSVGAQIAECWAKRRYEKHFISKLTDAEAEIFETQHWLELALECNFINSQQLKDLNTKCESLGKMINNMIQKAYKFCKT